MEPIDSGNQGVDPGVRVSRLENIVWALLGALDAYPRVDRWGRLRRIGSPQAGATGHVTAVRAVRPYPR